MFSGKTRLEDTLVATEDVKETVKSSETIQQAADRWRNNAFFTAEYLSENPETGSSYRITRKENLMFLERMTSNGASWTGVMFDYRDLPALAEVFVKAFREMKNGSY